MTEKINILVAVHLGSLYGSAKMHLGRDEARIAREEIFWEIDNHQGGLIIIDGFLSDEIPPEHQVVLQKALTRAQDDGHLALRVWGCDCGEDPYEDWSHYGKDRLIYGGQEEAIKALLPTLSESAHMTVTGAWATPDNSSGCASSVLMALKNHSFDAKLSAFALYEPNDDLEEELGELNP